MHLIVNVAGYGKAGPNRRPFAYISDKLEASAKKFAEVYRALASKYLLS